MKNIRLFLIPIFSILSIYAYGQSTDERLVQAINSGAWHKVRSLYVTEKESLQTPFLHPLTKFFISQFYNQPDSAIYYGATLLNEYNEDLGSSISSVVYLMASDYAKMNDYKSATDILNKYNEAVKAAGMQPDVSFVAVENQYDAIDKKGGFMMSRPNYEVKVPLKYHNTRENPVMLFVEAKLNDYKCDVTYDTGAGANIISKQLADKIGMNICDFQGLNLNNGLNSSTSRFAILDSLSVGEIIYKNVPFQVIDFYTGNQKADSVVDKMGLQCVIGLPMMFPLQEVVFDFENGYLKVPGKTTPKPAFAPNFYNSGENSIILSLYDLQSDEWIDAFVDTGASNTMLSAKYYGRNKLRFEGIEPTDSVRMAGLGGVKITRSIPYEWHYGIDKATIYKDTVSIAADSEQNLVDQYDCFIGLPTLVQHNRVTINFKEMWISFSDALVSEE